MKRIHHALLRLLALLWLCGLAACTSLPPASPQPAHYQAAPGAQGTTLRTPDGLTLFAQWWEPPAQPARAIILLVHGTAAHSGFYYPWAQQLTAQGYAVLAPDLRGWGQSQGHGRRGYVRDVSEYVDDLALAYREAKRRYPELPLFLQGESLGGAVVLLAELRGDLPVQGLILNAPGLKTNVIRALGAPNWLADGMTWTAGTAGLAWPNAPVIPMGSDFLFHQLGKLIIFDPEIKQRAMTDPFFTRTALPAAFITTVRDMTSRIQAGLPQVRSPFIVLQGSKDYLVPTAASELLMARAGSTDKTRKFYPGLSHCTLHDRGREQVWADTLAWLEARLPAAAPVEPQPSPNSASQGSAQPDRPAYTAHLSSADVRQGSWPRPF